MKGANLSFVVVDPERKSSERIIGAVLNFDARSAEAEPLCACAAFERERKKKIYWYYLKNSKKNY